MEEGKTIHNSQLTMHNCKEGYKKTELGWIPKEWDVLRISEITKEHKQGYYATNKYEEKGIYFVRITDLNNPKIRYDEMPKLDVDDEVIEQYKLEDGDFLFARSGAIGRYGIYKKEYPETVFASYLIRFRFNTLKVINEYIGYFYESEYSQKQLKAITQGSSNININANNIKSLLMCVPPLKEQQKIAEIFSTVDSQIDDTDKLIEKTKELKKGLMQRLLTKGIGHTEFKKTEIGEIPVEWEVKSLGKVFKLLSGEFLSKKNIIEGLYPVYGGNGITGYHNEFKHEDTKIVIGRVGAKCGCVCKSMKKSWITDNALYINEKLCEFDDEFMFYLLGYLDLNKFANQNAQPVISGQKIYVINVGLPGFEEQKQIANILSSVDTQIEEYENKKAKLEELKKGLMQQLLTGKIRTIHN